MVEDYGLNLSPTLFPVNGKIQQRVISLAENGVLSPLYDPSSGHVGEAKARRDGWPRFVRVLITVLRGADRAEAETLTVPFCVFAVDTIRGADSAADRIDLATRFPPCKMAASRRSVLAFRYMIAHYKPTKFDDGRRKHHHFEAKIFYEDGEVFVRRYIDREKANRFAERQRKSPVVKMARVTQVS